jgi:hypothetical protein
MCWSSHRPPSVPSVMTAAMVVAIEMYFAVEASGRFFGEFGFCVLMLDFFYHTTHAAGT